MTIRHRVVRAMRSPRAALGSAVALDLSVRAADLRPALGSAADLLAPLVSISVGAFAAAALGTVTTWLLFAVAFYLVAPRLLPRVGRPTTERRGFRLLFAGSCVALGWYMGAASTAAALTPATIAGLLGIGGGIAAATAGYLRFVAGWDLLAPDGEAVALVDAVVVGDATAERRRDRAHSGVTGAVADALWVVAVGVMVVLPALAGGVLSLVLVRAYPLPDLLAVGYLVGSPFASRLGWSGTTLGVEERVLLGAREATRTLKGATLALLSGLGLFGAGGFAFLAVGTTPGTVELAGTAAGVAPGLAWVALGGVGCLYASAAHLFWVWIRTFRRLPAYLASWRGADDPPAPPVARSPLSVLPALVALAGATGCFLLLGDASVSPVGWLWPLALVPAAATLAVGLRRAPGPTDGEDHRIVAAMLTEFLAFFTLTGSLEPLSTGAPVVGTLLDALLVPVHGVVAVIVLGAGYFADAGRYADAHEDYRRYAGAAHLAVMGTGVAVFGVVPGGRLASVFGLFAGVLFASAVAVGVVKWRRL